MKITVKAFATLRTVMDSETRLELPEGSTVAEALAVLGVRYPGLPGELYTERGTLRQYVNILLNGRNIVHLQGLITQVHDGDLLVLFPPAAGG